MTPQQVSDFNRFGCVSRSILKLCELKGQPTTKEAFCERFEDLFAEYGLLLTSQLPNVIRELGLGQHFLTFRRYDEIEGRFNANASVLVFSEINLNPGATDVVRHCSLLTGINPNGFSLFIPTENGDAQGTFEVSDWDTKLCHGLVIL